MSNTNFVAVFLAALAGFVIGWIWYQMFGRAWARGLGDPSPRGITALMIAAAGYLVMVMMLSGVIFHTGIWGVQGGMISGALLWTGFVLTSLGVTLTFQNRSTSVIAIDTGHWLVVLLAMGAIVGGFGPA